MRVEVGRGMCLTTWSGMSIPVVANEASSGYCGIFEIKVNVSKRNMNINKEQHSSISIDQCLTPPSPEKLLLQEMGINTETNNWKICQK